MIFEEAFQYARKGRKIRRRAWEPGLVYMISATSDSNLLTGDNLLKDDWEVVSLSFCTALNALMDGHRIRHIAQNAEDRLYLLPDGVHAGLGTSKARRYTFSEQDVVASDWVIEGRNN